MKRHPYLVAFALCLLFTAIVYRGGYWALTGR